MKFLFLKKALAILAVSVGLVAASAPVADAKSGWWSRWNNWKKERGWGGNGYRARRPGSRSVPELDPNAAGSAIVLVVGGVAYIASRRREEKELV